MSAARVGSMLAVVTGGRIVAVVAWKAARTNAPLVEGWRRLGIAAELLTAQDAARRLGPGDVALVRLDVTGTLDGIEPGLREVAWMARRGCVCSTVRPRFARVTTSGRPRSA